MSPWVFRTETLRFPQTLQPDRRGPLIGFEPTTSFLRGKHSGRTELQGHDLLRTVEETRTLTDTDLNRGPLPIGLRRLIFRVRTARVELASPCGHLGLSQACLPIPPRAHASQVHPEGKNFWYGRRDSNPQAFRQRILSAPCMPYSTTPEPFRVRLTLVYQGPED